MDRPNFRKQQARETLVTRGCATLARWPRPLLRGTAACVGDGGAIYPAISLGSYKKSLVLIHSLAWTHIKFTSEELTAWIYTTIYNVFYSAL